MVKPITYLLYKEEGTNNGTSDIYYEEISSFTDEVIRKMNRTIKHEVEGFRTFIVQNQIEPVRDILEYELEALMLGVLWNTYSTRAVSLDKLPKKVLIHLVYMRRNSKRMKMADTMRGVLSTLFLRERQENKRAIACTYSKENIKLLLDWLAATGEFTHGVRRLHSWSLYFEGKSDEKIKQCIRRFTDFSSWFEKRSEEVIGTYTKWVPEFLEDEKKEYRWREDYIFCGRKRVEYHLNMVGAEMLNRIYRDRFMKCKDKRVFLPGCMRAQSESTCKAEKTKNGLLCRQCTKNCRVNQYTELAMVYQCQEVVIEHESSIKGRGTEDKKPIGIVGVACVLNLIEGGWKALELGFVPQCVLLDYSGCRSHWHKDGIVTDLNGNRLRNVLGDCYQDKNLL